MQSACSILSSVTCLALLFFSTLPHQWEDLKKLLKIKYILIFFKLLSETFLILRRTERDVTKNVYWSACKVPVIVV